MPAYSSNELNPNILFSVAQNTYSLPLLLFSAVCLTVAYASYFLISRSYIAVITDVRGAKKTVYKSKTHEQRSVIAAVVRKELSRLVSSATDMLNGAFGIILGLMLTGAVLFASDGITVTMEPIFAELGIAPSDVIAPVLITLLVSISSMNMISSSALSLEGGSLWIIKSMPLSSKEILIAKTIPHIVVTAPPFVLFSIVCAIKMGVSAYYYPLYVLLPVAAAVMTALIGILLNVAFPKFDYVNEAQVVKQSLPTFLAMLIPMLLMIVFIGAVFFASLAGFALVVLWLALAVFVAVSFLLYSILAGPAARRLDRIEK